MLDSDAGVKDILAGTEVADEGVWFSLSLQSTFSGSILKIATNNDRFKSFMRKYNVWADSGARDKQRFKNFMPNHCLNDSHSSHAGGGEYSGVAITSSRRELCELYKTEENVTPRSLNGNESENSTFDSETQDVTRLQDNS